ncbi:DUF6506 family protein [Solwaraspora sp. WMMD1047]|uniref:DUF6506 family protein n=1 Tax=Solwaraspora sp. WMMD1047 TaxID=3016102 RepID=UPI00241637DE|nr:DUF6506 family protein [Solwaraspora sp. WMMD1047]MDG4834445.1 DUF6506 family protein [Solwaraspora sp. WMMD1047]
MKWAYIYEHPGSDPDADRVVLERGGQHTILVPVPEPAAAPAVASALADDGVRLIELCGGFTLREAAQVAEAVGGRVPVGHVSFAGEAAAGVASYAREYAAERAGPRA